MPYVAQISRLRCLIDSESDEESNGAIGYAIASPQKNFLMKYYRKVAGTDAEPDEEYNECAKTMQPRLPTSEITNFTLV